MGNSTCFCDCASPQPLSDNLQGFTQGPDHSLQGYCNIKLQCVSYINDYVCQGCSVLDQKGFRIHLKNHTLTLEKIDEISSAYPMRSGF